MSQLSLTLLGTLAITLDGQPVAGIESDKARALLAGWRWSRSAPSAARR